ncbi:MAG: glycosyltransferase family 9 protein [Lentimicrobiaceae bacterium]|nr:glycosyltransferase family 9 protein [Lentimicrobiaceae bacterium]
MKQTGIAGKLLISRTDSIGDVVLTLPLVGLIKARHPEMHIAFLGQSYTRAVIEACASVDEFIDWQQISQLSAPEQISTLKKKNFDTIIHVFPRKAIARIAKKASIPLRIGTTGRLYHWVLCNRLIRFSRRNSGLHEAQLNLKLAADWLDEVNIPEKEIIQYYGLTRVSALPVKLAAYLHPDKFNLILHPKSKGSAREWGSENFAALSELLPREKYNIIITGTQAEGDLLTQEGFFAKAGEINNLTGKMSLAEMLSFIQAADGLIAASTGPLHLAAALGKVALGIYPPIKPMHPGRWKPLGKHAGYLVAEKECEECRKSGPCLCMMHITPQQVKHKLESMVLTSRER